MSTTQGEAPVSRKGKIVTAIVAGVVSLGIVTGAAVFVTNVNANAAAHTQLMAGVKVDGQELGAAAKEDAELDATVEATARVKHVQELAAADTAARIAAEQAAAAEAARVAAEQAAAQQEAARQQTQRQQQRSTSDDEPGVPWVPTPGSDDGGRYDTTPCGAAGATLNPDGSVSCAG